MVRALNFSSFFALCTWKRCIFVGKKHRIQSLMNYSQLPQTNAQTPQSLGINTIGTITNENIGGKWLAVFRPREYRILDKTFMRHFRMLPDSVAGITSEFIMLPREFVEDERGGYFAFGHKRYVTLAQHLAENPASVADERWTTQLLNDLLTAIEQLDAAGLHELELSPVSILVGRTPPHSVLLMPPLSPFLDIRKDVLTKKSDYLAPEIFDASDNTQIDVRADLYAVAHVMQRVFKLSELPPAMRRFVDACSKENPDERPATVAKARAMLKTAQRKQAARHWGLAIATAIVIVGLVAWAIGGEGTSEATFRETNPFEIDSSAVSDQTESNLIPGAMTDILAADTNLLRSDSAYIISPEQRKAEQEREKKAMKDFSRQYRRVAKAILAPVYTPDNLFGDRKHFMQISLQAMNRLNDIAHSMQNQYQIDNATAEAIAAEIIGEITDELRKDAAEAKPKASTQELPQTPNQEP